MTPQPPSSAPAQKKPMSGCLIAVFVFGGLLMVSCLVISFGVWRAAQSDEARKAFDVLGKGAALVGKSVTAPGTKELREAGCATPLVLDVGEMVGMFGELFDAGAMPEKDRFEGRAVVMCQPAAIDAAPDCDALATIYADAARPDAGFMVMVQRQQAKHPTCMKEYDAQGGEKRDLQP